MAQTKTSITPAELQHLAQAGPIELLDVRTPGEFASAHVPNARLAPLDQLDPDTFLRERDAKDRPIYVLCQTGGRARKAIERFERSGFDGCVLVEGGTEAWIAAGLPVMRGKSRILPLMQQVQLLVGAVTAAGAILALTVDARFALVPLVTGCGLVFAGLTGICGLALLLAKMPWNRAVDCDSRSCCTGGKLVYEKPT